jgi:hypothetical protein
MKNEEEVLWLAKEMAHPVYGTDTFDMDWGNVWIKCSCVNVKNTLTQMATDYLRLKKLEPLLGQQLTELMQEHLRLKELEQKVKDAII